MSGTVNQHNQELLAERRKRLEQLACRVAATEDGCLFIRHIMDICGFKKPSTVANPQTGEICTQSTQYNEARRSVYINIRDLIRPELQDNIERNWIQELMVEEQTNES